MGVTHSIDSTQHHIAPTTQQTNVHCIPDGEVSEILKALLGNETFSPQEQQLIQVAFTEGCNYSNSILRRPRWPPVILGILHPLLWIMGFILVLDIHVLDFPEQLEEIAVSLSEPKEASVTFDDIKGVDEEKQELQEILDFLHNPEHFSALGGRLPKGILLTGKPGTGKTLLARAMAGASKLPFFRASGREFKQSIAGRTARRLRNFFSKAKSSAPCIIFIDEIDSIGKKRTNLPKHPNRNEAINQLLVEMDKLNSNKGVIVIGATSQKDSLDKALLRPGRFDVHITLPIPDVNGRKEILQLYLSKVTVGQDVNIDVLAQTTTDCTGAKLECLVTEAELKAKRERASAVTMRHLEDSKDIVCWGLELKSRITKEKTTTTAYHEAGHALVSHYTKSSRCLNKVSIIPSQSTLGYTDYTDEENTYITKSELLDKMDTLMAGRAAEELLFPTQNDVSGCEYDLKVATDIAQGMVKDWGMSDMFGVRTFKEDQNPFVGASESDLNTLELVNVEVNQLISASLERAKNILTYHMKELKALAAALLKYRILDADTVRSIIASAASEDE